MDDLLLGRRIRRFEYGRMDGWEMGVVRVWDIVRGGRREVFFLWAGWTVSVREGTPFLGGL